ncbi:alpha/beta fold hydrolase [Nocardia sp. NBC_00403]|uniref:alpha/beta fold hydrolase n=1 Tax=Nocardia sp. NBC_00403 TaxID=2975990 RepID=UPI002E1DE979
MKITKPFCAMAAVAALLITGCGTEESQTASSPTTSAAAPDRASADGKGFYAPINGLQLYYEVHGAGRPLVLLHGGLGTADTTFVALLPELAKTRKVITVDLQAHGHTGDIDRPLRFELMADDISGLITHLGLGKADVLGYSLGGGVALQLAGRHPELVGRQVVISAPFRSDGWTPEGQAGMAALNPDTMLETPIHALYTATAPNPADWSALVTKTRQLLTESYDWTAQVAAIRVPTLLVLAESDVVRPQHAEELGALLGGARMVVAPGTTHYDMMYRADLLLPAITPFLEQATTPK